MKLTVIDTETSGLSDTDQIVELAAVTLESGPSNKWHITRASTQLVKPSVPVSVEARAVHHISDGQLANAPDIPRLIAQYGAGGIIADICAANVLAAHNLAFDARMMVQSGLGHILPAKTLCTWRCAMHLYPDAPGHSNQVLRYYLDGIAPMMPVRYFGMPPHRALPDAMTTAAILARMLADGNEVDELIRLTECPVLLKTVRMGKYRGQLWSAMDNGYLSWVLGKDFDADIKYTARHYLDRGRILGLAE